MPNDVRLQAAARADFDACPLPGPSSERPHQLWLDVARPIQTRPRHRIARAERRAKDDLPPVSGQMELRMAPKPAIAKAIEPMPLLRARPKIDYAAPVEMGRPQCFVAWLLNQTRQSGTLGELAKAAKLDRAFPKTGSANDVRARFSEAGADGDAFEALDDAEREFDRLR